MPPEDVPPNAFHAPRALFRRIGQFVRESALAAPVLALLTATKLLPAPVAVPLGLLLAFLLRGRPGGARLAAPPWGRTADAVALLLAAAAIGGALKSMRPLKNWPAATDLEAGIRPKLPLGRSKDGGAAAATAEKHGAVGATKAEKATAAHGKAMADAAKAEVGAAAKKLAAADARKAKEEAAAKAKAAAGAPKAEQTSRYRNLAASSLAFRASRYPKLAASSFALRAAATRKALRRTQDAAAKRKRSGGASAAGAEEGAVAAN